MPRHKSYVPHGVIPAVLLPFDADLAIDEASFRKHLRDVAATPGVTGITINAHSTEVASCTFEEQRRVLEVTQAEIGDRMPIVNGIWADGSIEAARLARMATEGGASALLVFPPAPFTLGQSPQMAIAHFKRIADATDLPLIVFQYPLATGQGYPKDTLLRTVRGGADHPRHQGLDQQCPAPRVARAHTAKPASAGQRAVDPQRLAVLLARARLQWPAVGQRQRHPRPAVAAVCRRAAQRSRRGARAERSHRAADARVLRRSVRRHAQSHEGGAGAARPHPARRSCGRRWSRSRRPRSAAFATA